MLSSVPRSHGDQRSISRDYENLVDSEGAGRFVRKALVIAQDKIGPNHCD